MGYLFESEDYMGGGGISVDLSQKGGATQRRLGNTTLDEYMKEYKTLHLER